MRNPQTLQRQLFINCEVRPEVVGQQLPVDFLESIDGQRLSVFAHVVCQFLKFGEHGLTNDRSPDRVNLVVDQIRFQPVVGCLFQHVPRQQLLVKCTGDFSHEDRVRVIFKRLMFDGIVGVH